MNREEKIAKNIIGDHGDVPKYFNVYSYFRSNTVPWSRDQSEVARVVLEKAVDWCSGDMTVLVMNKIRKHPGLMSMLNDAGVSLK